MKFINDPGVGLFGLLLLAVAAVTVVLAADEFRNNPRLSIWSFALAGILLIGGAVCIGWLARRERD